MTDDLPADDGMTPELADAAAAIVHERQPDAADLPDAVRDGEAGQTSADADDGSATHEEHA